MALTLQEDAGPFWLRDFPADPYVSAVLDEDEEAVELPENVTAGLLAPDGTYAIPMGPVTVDQAAATFSFPWGTESPFTVRGIHYLAVNVGGLAVDPLPVVVQSQNGWHTLNTARVEWRDLPTDPAVAFSLLEVAAAAIIEFAPAIPAGGAIPVSYRQAQLLQARNVWNSGHVDPATGDLGSAGFALTPFPLDWMVKQLVRPKRATPRVEGGHDV